MRIQPLVLLFLAHTISSCGGPAKAPERSPSTEELVRLLRRAEVIDGAHVLVHVSQTCDLTSDGGLLHVLDVREIGKTASSPRGINHIVVLSSDWRLVQDLPYVNQRPLFCRGAQLVLYGPLAIRNEMPEGNVLEFRERGKKIVVSDLDFNSLPTIEQSGGLPK